MKTLRYIAENIDKSSSNEESVDTCELGQEFNLNVPWVEQERLKAYWIGGWHCTDTWVGYLMYFLDDEPVGMSSQEGRKCDIEFEWFSKEAASKVRDYLLSLMGSDNLNCKIVSLDEEVEEGYKIDFNSQIIHGTNVTYKGKDGTIVGKFKHTDWHIDTLVKVEFEDGTTEIVEVGSLTFKFNLNGEQNGVNSYKLETLTATDEDLKKSK